MKRSPISRILVVFILPGLAPRAATAAPEDDCTPYDEGYTVLNFVADSYEDVGRWVIEKCAEQTVNEGLPGVRVRSCRNPRVLQAINERTRASRSRLIEQRIIMAVVGVGTRLEHVVIPYELDIPSARPLVVPMCTGGDQLQTVGKQYEARLAVFLTSAVAFYEVRKFEQDPCHAPREVNAVLEKALAQLSATDEQEMKVRQRLAQKQAAIQATVSKQGCGPSALNQRILGSAVN